MAYTPPVGNDADLIFSGTYSSPSGDDADLIFGGEEEVIRTILYQIWTDENYVYCATANGLGVVPL